MAVTKTGIFYMQQALQPGAGAMVAFPRDLRARLLANLEPRFVMLFAGSLAVIGGLVFALSFRKPSETLSDRQILRIQERYANIVLNQPKPKVEEVKKEAATEASGAAARRQDAGEAKKEEAKVNRDKETFTAREERRAATRADRAARRAQVTQEVSSSGIFAAITAVGGKGGSSSSSITDLLGATDVVSGLGDISVGSGGFAAAKGVDAATLKSRKGERTSGVGIQRQAVGTAAVTQIASSGAVRMSSEPAQMKGDEAHVSTSRSCLNGAIGRESSRLKKVYETWLKRDPQLSGRMKIRFTILANGSVASVDILQTTTNNSSFDDNIVRYVKRWDFSQCPLGSSIEIELPLVFEGQSQ